MKDHYDFAKGERGKFYRPDAEHQIPVYLDGDVLEFLTARARAKGVELGDLANEMLKKDITDVVLQRGGATIVLKAVPAVICDNCGEYYLDQDVADRAYALADTAVKQGAEVEIKRFAA